MLPFIIRRLIVSILVLLVSTFGVFVLQANSGNPLATLTQRQPPPPPSTINALRDQLHLNVPVPIRYFYWLGGVLHGDLGKNINGIPVNSQIFARLGTTLQLVVVAMLVAVILAIITGVISAVKQYSVVDYSTTFIGFILISIPTFWMAGLLKDVAIRINQNAGSQIFSFSGQSTPDYNGGFFGNISDRASHLILPTITLALISYASWSRYQRASMLDVLNSDYMRLARAKGVPWRKVLVKHGLRTALIPLTTVVAVGFGAIIGGAVVTETVFDWHGMGEYLLQAATTIDTNEMLAWLLFSAMAVVVFNLIADILYAVLDPRIRLA